MFLHRVRPSILLLAALLAPSSLFGQRPDQNASASVPSQPVLRSTSRLVQVNVIVQDRKGKPVTNLKLKNFTILDEGRPQHVAFFATETRSSDAPPLALPPNVFTNRFDIKGQDPGSVTIVLFDALNTSFEDQAYVRAQVLRFLKAIRPQDHVAAYALTTRLVILHEFTTDASSLVRAVNRFQPNESAFHDASNPEKLDVPALRGDPGWDRFQAAMNNAWGETSDAAQVDRFRITAGAIETIADHVAGIPGRKNLIWISDGMPNMIGFDRIGVPDRNSVEFDGAGYDKLSPPPAVGDSSATGEKEPGSKHSFPGIMRSPDPLYRGFAGVAQALNRVNMAIYPVDAHGLEIDAKAFFDRQNRFDTFRILADRTGGKAFYGTNDIVSAMQTASEDARYSYTIGYYPDHGQWDGKFRKIKIQVNVSNAQLRYRNGYFAVADTSNDEPLTRSILQTAALSPLEATTLGLIVSGKPVPDSAGRVVLKIGLDPKQFLLNDSEGRRVGGLDLLFLQRNDAGDFVAADRQHFGLNFTPVEFVSLSKAGLILQRTLSVPETSVEIRIVVRDANSGALGSVSLPTKSVFSAPSTSPAN